MSQSLYSILKPLVFEGESGVLLVKHRYGGEGTIELREGLIADVQTGDKSGRDAIMTLNCWVSIGCEFKAGAANQGAVTSGVDTSEVLKFLEKVESITQKINKFIPDHQIVFSVSAAKLKNNSKLTGKDLKHAQRVDGVKSVEMLIRESPEREIDVLARICRLVSLGIATIVENVAEPKEVETIADADVEPSKEGVTALAADKRLSFLAGLEKKLGNHFGPAAGIFIGELLTDMGFQAKTLTEDQAYDLIDKLGEHMDDGEVAQIEYWATNALA